MLVVVLTVTLKTVTQFPATKKQGTIDIKCTGIA